MTTKDDKTSDELDLDLEGALDDWEKEFESDGFVQAESAPMPQTGKLEAPPPAPPTPPTPTPPPAAPPQRHLYRPPTAEEIEEARKDPNDFSVDFDDDDDDDDDGATKIAAIPAELIASLQEGLADPTKARKLEEALSRETRPPPAEPPPGADLELDDLLDGFDDAESATVNVDIPSLPSSRPPLVYSPAPLPPPAAVLAAAAEDNDEPEMVVGETVDLDEDAFAEFADLLDDKDPLSKSGTRQPAASSDAGGTPTPAPMAEPAAPEASAEPAPAPVPVAPPKAYVPRPPPGLGGGLTSGRKSLAGLRPRSSRVGAPTSGELDLAAGATLAKPAFVPPPPIGGVPASMVKPVAPSDAPEAPAEADDATSTPPTAEPSEALDIGDDAREDEPVLEVGDDDEPMLEVGDDDDVLEVGDDDDVLEVGDDDDVLEVGDGDDVLEVSDDEPMLEVGDDDDVLEVGDDVLEVGDDDDEPMLEVGDGESAAAPLTPEGAEVEGPPSDLSMLAPPPREPAPGPKSSGDQGADAARRTVQYRKPRPERFPLVGRSPETLRARRALLEKMTEGASGAMKARLLVATAELSEQLGDHAVAREHYVSAREADGRDLIALRAVRREAIRRQDWNGAATLLEAEANLPLAPHDKALTLTLLAEIQLNQLGDTGAAQRSARTAVAADRSSAPAALLLAETSFVQGREPEGLMAVEKAAGIWEDGVARASLLLEVGRQAESSGQTKRAASLYAKAVEAAPEALDARLCLARAARSLGDHGTTIDALAAAGASLPAGELREAALRLATMVAQHRAKAPEKGSQLLADARGVLALRTRAAAAAAAGDSEGQLGAVEAWAQAAGGTDRAQALVLLAELCAELGDPDAADAALRNASLADSSLGTIRVVREVLARRAGDASRLSRVLDEDEGAGASGLAAAAKVASDRKTLERERELLQHAVTQGDAPATADVLSFDAAAEAGDTEAVRAGLQRAAERSSPEHRVGALLALSEIAIDSGDAAGAIELLRGALEVAPGDPLVLRPLARLLSASAPVEAAALWLEEASATDGERAAYAATRAGRILAAADAEATTAFRRALGAMPTYAPAAWAIESLLRAANDFITLEEVHTGQAEAGDDPLDAAGHWVRAAFLRAQRDPAGAAGLLERAREARPDDAMIYELMLRLGASTDPVDRGELLEASAALAGPEIARTARLRAAANFEDGGEHARAAGLYRTVLEAHEADPVASDGLERAELAAGEHVRVADRRFAAVRGAEDDEAKVAALASLADLDLYDRADTSSAILSLQSILELAPGHLPTLRALERYFCDQARDEELAAVERALVEHLPVAADATAHLRLATRLALKPDDAAGEAADDVLLVGAGRGAIDGWSARRAAGAARQAGARDVLVASLVAAAEAMVDPDERASMLLRAAGVASVDEGPAAAAALLASAAEAAPDHPAASEILAQHQRASDQREAAAETFERAAKAARVDGHATSLWYSAAQLWQDDVDNADRALAALEAAAALDVAHLDVFDRIKRILEERGDTRRLADVTAQRLAVGGDTPVLVELHVARSQLCEQISDVDGAKDALRAALALEPERVDALKRLSELCLESDDWRGAAESLIRIARLRQDRDELRWVFFTLGDIYDTHMPDPKRAEAAFRRVLKLLPDDVVALERLSTLYQREQNHEKAVEMLGLLAEAEVDPDKNRGHRLALAAAHEAMGAGRQAEAVLEKTRRNAPTDLTILSAMAEFYRRQDAQSALAMHLNRAVSDFRRAIGNDPTDPDAWGGLAEVLAWRGRDDAARCTASAGAALGIVNVELSKRLDAQGGVPGAGKAILAGEADEFLAPPILNRAARHVFNGTGGALEKALPFDTRAWKADKASAKDPARQRLAHIADALGLGEATLLISSAAPRICAPVTHEPLTVVVGRELVSGVSERGQAFLFTRSLRLAMSHLSVAARAQPAHVAALVAGLIKSYDPMYSLKTIDLATIDDMARRVHKALGRRTRDELTALVMEMGGTQDFDPMLFGPSTIEFGNRAALVATGDMKGALEALLFMAGTTPTGDHAAAHVAAVRQTPEAWSLLSFSISDAYYQARERVGADRL